MEAQLTPSAVTIGWRLPRRDSGVLRHKLACEKHIVKGQRAGKPRRISTILGSNTLTRLHSCYYSKRCQLHRDPESASQRLVSPKVAAASERAANYIMSTSADPISQSIASVYVISRLSRSGH